MIYCYGCGQQIHETAPTCPHCGAPQKAPAAAPAPTPSPAPAPSAEPLPPGVAGFSWGALLLNWIWALFNSVWIGLLALIPYVGFVVAIWLGFKGREMAWRARRWESVEHFNRVQKAWSRWAVGIVVAIFVLGIFAAIAIPAYDSYQQAAAEAQAQAEYEVYEEQYATEESTVYTETEATTDMQDGDLPTEEAPTEAPTAEQLMNAEFGSFALPGRIHHGSQYSTFETENGAALLFLNDSPVGNAIFAQCQPDAGCFIAGTYGNQEILGVDSVAAL